MRVSTVIPAYAVVGALLGFAGGRHSHHALLGIGIGFVLGAIIGAIGIYFKTKE